MEALIGSDIEAPVLADHIRTLQQEWKDLDATDPYHSHDLWKRFKHASDQAYEPCSQHYAELKQQRVNNLQQRLLLCEQLETLMANTDWEQPDWQEVEQISRTAKQEWRQYTPVDRTPGREAQSRFNSTLKQLDGKIKAYREANTEAKQALADQAEALSVQAEQAVADGQQELLNGLLRQVKQLQQQWRQTGNSFHSVERKLWPAFRLTCNKVYDLEKSNRKAVKTQQTEQEKPNSYVNSWKHYRPHRHRHHKSAPFWNRQIFCARKTIPRNRFSSDCMLPKATCSANRLIWTVCLKVKPTRPGNVKLTSVNSWKKNCWQKSWTTIRWNSLIRHGSRA
ncbi:DUF349 domain-containing protein [Aliamphritea spongicola]|nr:DUF349 domain-containing protein [Aliamphritea spongicola]